MTNPGPELALLLLAAYRKLVDDAIVALADRGYPDVTTTQHYAMTAIDGGASTASELGHALAVTKQAAAKTVAALEARKFIEVGVDPGDSRRKALRVTDLGHRVMREGAAIFDDLRAQWIESAGGEAISQLERTLRDYSAGKPVRLDAPGWSQDAEPVSRTTRDSRPNRSPE